MNLLIIDTSQKIGVVALYRHGFELLKKEFDAREQQRVLIDSIDSLFKESKIDLEDLTSIATCIGPGSFTGTRIGVMTAKTLAYTLNLPITPFHSLIPYHTPETLTILGLKNELCYYFNGTTLEKVAISSLIDEKLPLYSLNPEMVSLPTKQATYSFDNLLTLAPQEEITLIY